MTDLELATALESPATRTRAAKAIAHGIYARNCGGRTSAAADAETAWECVGQQTRELAFAHVDAIVQALKTFTPEPTKARRR